MTRITALMFCAIACGGRLVPDGDAAAADAASDTDADPGVAVCSSGAPRGSCPAGWHCDILMKAGNPWNVCCPEGQTGTSNQCINPQD